MNDVPSDMMLVNAAAFERLLASTDAQLQQVEQSMAKYEAVKRTLQSLLQCRQREVFVPVAGGLAYFEASIVDTNNLLVLLGDNWFAECGSSHAATIADRRIAFLSNEKGHLLQRRQAVLAKMQWLTRGEGETIGAAADAQMAVPAPPVTAAPISSGESDAFDGEAEALIDPADELSMEELIALEEELGDDIEDEAVAEAAILRLVQTKKRARLQTNRARGIFGAQTASVIRTPADVGAGVVCISDGAAGESDATARANAPEPRSVQPDCSGSEAAVMRDSVVERPATRMSGAATCSEQKRKSLFAQQRGTR